MLPRGLTAVLVASTVLLAACNGDDGSSVDTGATTTAGGESTTTSGPPTTVTPPFEASVEPNVSTESQGAALLVSVAEGIAGRYQRFVFQFVDANAADPANSGPARPAWDVRYVPPDEVVQDGSGNPVIVPRAEHLRIRFKADMHDRDGKNTPARPVAPNPDLVFGSDFEGSVTWFYGTDSKRPFRVAYLGDGRIAVDVQS